MRTGTTGYMSRRIKVIAVDKNEDYWLPTMEELLASGYKIIRVEKVNQGFFKGEAIIFILENDRFAIGN